MDWTKKNSNLRELLKLEKPIMVQFNGQYPGCRIPESLKKDPKVVLKFNQHRGAKDLTDTEDGISETLRFAGFWTDVFVPWNAIYVMTCGDDELYVYKDDIPDEVLYAPAELQQLRN